MSFNHADDYIFSAFVPADGFAEHVVGFADTRSVAEKDLEDSDLLLGCSLLQPLFRRLTHEAPQPNRSRLSYNQRVKITSRVALRILICAIVTLLIVVVYSRFLRVNPTTVALTFVLAVLSVAAAWGLRYAIPLSIAAALCFNFFFLPPVGTFTIADTQNWIALLAFFVTSVIASQLSERARRQTREANLRKLEVERLYTLSQQLLISENVLDLLKFVPRYVTETFGLEHAALYVMARDQSYRSDPE